MMYFNPTKYYVMRFARSKSPIITAYILCNPVLEEHHTNPYLGVLLSDNAKWSAHISATCSKAKSTLVFCCHNLFNCPRELKELAYIAYEVGICIMCVESLLRKDIKAVESVQRRSARFGLSGLWLEPYCNTYVTTTRLGNTRTEKNRSQSWLLL